MGSLLRARRSALVTERPGRVRIVENGQLRPEPALTLTDVFTEGEAGLLGVALDPTDQLHRLVTSASELDKRAELQQVLHSLAQLSVGDRTGTAPRHPDDQECRAKGHNNEDE